MNAFVFSQVTQNQYSQKNMNGASICCYSTTLCRQNWAGTFSIHHWTGTPESKHFGSIAEGSKKEKGVLFVPTRETVPTLQGEKIQKLKIFAESVSCTYLLCCK